MKEIIAFSASDNLSSINHDLLMAATNHIDGANVQVLRLSGISLPVYNEYLEKKSGIPLLIQELFSRFAGADGFIIACPEHNGLPPASFKNMLDWLSRVNQNIFNNKPVLLLSTSPGGNGGNSSLRILASLMPRWGGNVAGVFSLGAFYERFDRNNMLIADTQEQQRLLTAVQAFEEQVDVMARRERVLSKI